MIAGASWGFSAALLLWVVWLLWERSVDRRERARLLDRIQAPEMTRAHIAASHPSRTAADRQPMLTSLSGTIRVPAPEED